MAGLLNKIQQLWNVPDDEYDESEEEYEERPQEQEQEEDSSYDWRRSDRYGEERHRGYRDQESSAYSNRSRGSSYGGEASVSGNRVVNIHATTQLQVVLFKPERFGEEARNIADELLKMHTVVLNLEDTNKDVSRRIVDFLSGVAYANGGKIKRVATDTFIITPYNVDLMGDDVLDEL